MAFKKGISGNPGGRPKGTTHASKIRSLISAKSKELIDQVITLALAGDTTALKICLERICPALKSKDELCIIPELNNVESLTSKGDVIINAVGSGKLTTSEAGTLLSALANQAKLTEIDDLTQRIETLETKL